MIPAILIEHYAFATTVLVTSLVVIVCDIASTLSGIRQLRHRSDKTAHTASMWMYVGIAAIVIIGLLIFLPGP
jgi:K+-transporting ATPase A subunit